MDETRNPERAGGTVPWLMIAAGLFVGCRGGVADARPPRLVILYATCTLNKNYIAPYAPVRTTPELERFASESLVFDRHVTEAGVSGIAYASIVSGAQADVHGVCQHPHELSDDLYLVTEAFADAGYDVHFWEGHRMATARLGYAQGVPPENVHGMGELALVKRSLYDGDAPFMHILRRLRDDPEYKAMIFVAFTVTHAAYNAQVRPEEFRRFLDLYPETAPGLSMEEIERLGALYKEHRLALQWNYDRAVQELGLSPVEEEHLADVLETYYRADVKVLDTLFGRMLATLRESGLYDQALIAFTADHGEVLARPNALFRWGHGLALAPEVLNVPWILHLPRSVGRTGHYAGVTRSIDVYPTLAGLCNLRVSGTAGIEGVDLSPAVLETAAPPDVLAPSHTKVLNAPLVELFADWPHVRDLYPSSDPRWMWVSARREDTFYRIRHLGADRWIRQVFDLRSDPELKHDLYDPGDPSQDRVFAWLRAYKQRLAAACTGGSLPAGEVEEGLRALGYIR